MLSRKKDKIINYLMDNELEIVFEKILEKVPKDIDFGFIAVKNEVTKTIQIENTNKFQIPFWRTSALGP